MTENPTGSLDKRKDLSTMLSFSKLNSLSFSVWQHHSLGIHEAIAVKLRMFFCHLVAWALGKVWIDFKFLRLEVAVSRLKIAAMPLWRLCILLAT